MRSSCGVAQGNRVKKFTVFCFYFIKTIVRMGKACICAMTLKLTFYRFPVVGCVALRLFI
jgi:hypothetical protein